MKEVLKRIEKKRKKIKGVEDEGGGRGRRR